MIASILGATHLTCQIPALREGFRSFGHEHTDNYSDENVAFIFEGNPWYETYNEILNKSLEKKTIYNVLDIPEHLFPNYDLGKLKQRLSVANKVTCISKFVQQQLKDYINIDSEVIYYPMKSVKYINEKKFPEIKVLLVGRINDPNKRAASSISAVLRAGYKENEIGIVGTENPHFGRYFGLVDDKTLNELYNSVDYVMMLSRIEGIGLPAIEAACAGAIPIVAPDLTTFEEFWVQSPLGLHYQQLTTIDAVSKLIIELNKNEKWKNEVKQDLLGYSELFFKPKFDKIEVAKKLIDIYHIL